MDRATLRRQSLPILILLAVAAALVGWSPAAASASTSFVVPTVAGTSLVTPTVADTSPGNPSSADAPFAPATAAQTNEPVVRFGEDVVVAAGETYEGLVVFGGDVDVQGTVEGPVVAFGGDVRIAGTVTEEVVAFGGRVVLAGTARVGTSLSAGEDGVIAFGGQVDRAPGAEVSGDVREIEGGDLGSVIGWVVGTGATQPFREFFSFGGWVVTTLVFLVLGLVAAALLPNQIRAVGRQLAARPAASLGWGALTFFVLAPLVIIALIISVVGILVVIPVIVMLPLASFFAVVCVGTFIAERFVAGRVSDRNQLFLATTIGVVATSIVSVVPVLGGLLILVMMLFGIGAALMAIGDWRRRRRALAAATLPPGAPVPPGTSLPPGGGVPPYQPAGQAYQPAGPPYQPMGQAYQPAGQAWQVPPTGQPEGWPPQATEPPAAAAPAGDGTTAVTQAQAWPPAAQAQWPPAEAAAQGPAPAQPQPDVQPQAAAQPQPAVQPPVVEQTPVSEPSLAAPVEPPQTAAESVPPAAPDASPETTPDAAAFGGQEVNTEQVVDAGAGGQTPSDEQSADDTSIGSGDEPETASS